MKTFIEHDNEIVLDEAVKYHVDNEIPLTQSVFRMYSENFFNLFKKVAPHSSSGTKNSNFNFFHFTTLG